MDENKLLDKHRFRKEYYDSVCTVNRCYQTDSYPGTTLSLRSLAEEMLKNILEQMGEDTTDSLHSLIETFKENIDIINDYCKHININRFMKSLKALRIRGNGTGINSPSSYDELERFFEYTKYSIYKLAESDCKFNK